jgi:hypothetical protein
MPKMAYEAAMAFEQAKSKSKEPIMGAFVTGFSELKFKSESEQRLNGTAYAKQHGKTVNYGQVYYTIQYAYSFRKQKWIPITSNGDHYYPEHHDICGSVSRQFNCGTFNRVNSCPYILRLLIHPMPILSRYSNLST